MDSNKYSHFWSLCDNYCLSRINDWKKYDKTPDPFDEISVIGYNCKGAFGNGLVPDNNFHCSPVSMGGEWKCMLVAGCQTTMAIKEDNTLWAWGENRSGEFGVGDRICRTTPVQVPGTWTDIKLNSGNNNVIMGLRPGNCLYIWGAIRNESGVIQPTSHPMHIPGVWKTLPNDINGTVYGAIREVDNSIWMFGRALNNRIMFGSCFNSMPVKLSGTWSSFSIGCQFAIGIKRDNSMWVWGSGAHELGVGADTHIDLPGFTRIPGSWKCVHIRGKRVKAIGSNDNLWTWGVNQSGLLGTGDFDSLSRPALISGKWKCVLDTGSAIFAENSAGKMYGWGRAMMMGCFDVPFNEIYTSPVLLNNCYTDIFGSSLNTFFAIKS